MDSNLMLSFELICFMNWLLRNHKKKLDELIKNAMDNGFLEELGRENADKSLDMASQLPNIILDFLLYLEDSLFDSLEKMDLDKNTKDKLVPDLKKIDTPYIDPRTILLSLQQTKILLKNLKIEKIRKEKLQKLETTETHPEINNPSPKEVKKILFEQLLKNWNPGKNEPIN